MKFKEIFGAVAAAGVIIGASNFAFKATFKSKDEAKLAAAHERLEKRLAEDKQFAKEKEAAFFDELAYKQYLRNRKNEVEKEFRDNIQFMSEYDKKAYTEKLIELDREINK